MSFKSSLRRYFLKILVAGLNPDCFPGIFAGHYGTVSCLAGRTNFAHVLF
jgi:hypothetical protein